MLKNKLSSMLDNQITWICINFLQLLYHKANSFKCKSKETSQDLTDFIQNIIFTPAQITVNLLIQKKNLIIKHQIMPFITKMIQRKKMTNIKLEKLEATFWEQNFQSMIMVWPQNKLKIMNNKEKCQLDVFMKRTFLEQKVQEK